MYPHDTDQGHLDEHNHDLEHRARTVYPAHHEMSNSRKGGKKKPKKSRTVRETKEIARKQHDQARKRTEERLKREEEIAHREEDRVHAESERRYRDEEDSK